MVFRFAKLLIAAASLQLVFAPTVTAQELEPESTGQIRGDAVNELLVALEGLAMFSGHVIIDQSGEVFSQSYGMANYEHRVPVTPDTPFRVASISKTLTDAALAVLISESRLSLETSLDEYLPDFPSASSITIRHLITHRSGIPHTNTLSWGDGRTSLALLQIIDLLRALPLDFEPGSESRYSNGGYAVLARLLELETGETYGELMAHLVFEPLGMTKSGAVEDSRAVIPGLAHGYEPGPGRGSRRHSRPYAVEIRPGGGSLYASPNDLLRFFRAIYRDGYPEAAVNEAVFGPRDEVRSYSGRSPGFNSVAFYDPATDQIVISVANNYAADFAWAANLSSLALGRPAAFQSPPAVDRDFVPGTESRLIGSWRYENPRFSQVVEIAADRAGNLVLHESTSESQTALVPLEGGGFLEPMYFGICRLAEDDPDRIECGRFYEGGFRSDLVRRDP